MVVSDGALGAPVAFIECGQPETIQRLQIPAGMRSKVAVAARLRLLRQRAKNINSVARGCFDHSGDIGWRNAI